MIDTKTHFIEVGKEFICSQDKHTPLIKAVIKGDYSEVVNLVENGVNINEVIEDTVNGRPTSATAVSVAAYVGDMPILLHLLSNGGNPNYVPETNEIYGAGCDQSFPLHFQYRPIECAAVRNNTEAFLTLVNKGARISLRKEVVNENSFIECVYNSLCFSNATYLLTDKKFTSIKSLFETAKEYKIESLELFGTLLQILSEYSNYFVGYEGPKIIYMHYYRYENAVIVKNNLNAIKAFVKEFIGEKFPSEDKSMFIAKACFFVKLSEAIVICEKEMPLGIKSAFSYKVVEENNSYKIHSSTIDTDFFNYIEGRFEEIANCSEVIPDEVGIISSIKIKISEIQTLINELRSQKTSTKESRNENLVDASATRVTVEENKPQEVSR